MGNNPDDINVTATDWFWITGRGAVATFSLENNPDFDTSILPTLTGMYLHVDGNEYQCTGVERFAVSWDHPANLRGPWGILVKPQFTCMDSWHYRSDKSANPEQCFTCHQKALEPYLDSRGIERI